jgi:hypothetical protein
MIGHKDQPVKRVLNAGSGPSTLRNLHPAFSTRGWAEVRLDIDPAVKPDIVGSIHDMTQEVPDRSLQAVWSSHNLEHLHSFEVHRALCEFRRVLSDDGFVFITCPDLESIAEHLLAHGLTKPAYQSSSGPITPLDMLFGHGRSIAAGNKYMCHKTGFTQDTLGRAAIDAGFYEARVAKGSGFDLWGLFSLRGTNQEMLCAMLENTPQAFLVERDKAGRNNERLVRTQ